MTVADSPVDTLAAGEPLAEIIDRLPQGVLVFGPDRRVVLVNRAFAQVMSDAEVAVGDDFDSILRRRIAAGEYGPGDPDVLLARHRAYDMTRPQTRRRRRPNGTILENRWVPLTDGGFMILCSDITSLVGAQEALARRGEETDILLAGMRHGLILWGPDQRLLAANPMAATLLGVPVQSLSPGRQHDELIDGLLATGYFGSGPLAQAVAREVKGRDWSQPWVRHFVNPAGRFIERRADPVAAGMNLTTLTDITEQREAEHALRRAKESAEAASQAKSRFLATMSHELRTPLNAVIGYSDALVQEAALVQAAGNIGGRIGEYAGAVNEAGRRLLGLIDTLLDVARLETGRFDLAEDAVDIGRLIRTTLRRFEAAAAGAEIVLTLLLPQPEALPLVLADRRRLGQVLNQLMSNALKFTPAGGAVTVSVGREGEELALTIADTGIGIAEADLVRVFDPFTQVDATLARRFPGAGLGLYLARALVESHGGVLRLASRQGEGTTAEVRLPRHRLLPARAGVAPPHPRAPRIGPARDGASEQAASRHGASKQVVSPDGAPPERKPAPRAAAAKSAANQEQEPS
ncbi:MAG: PAS domain-containing protein [Proteobacteria bacterium]|nr:PAS domain-containing protein [Pseudomonadota bacterium]